MTSSLKKSGIRLTATIVAVATISLLAAGPANAGVGMKCPGTFMVQHNDKIGKLKLPAGSYQISVKQMSCQRASSLFAKFLQRPDGNLPNGWRLNVNRQKFSNPKRNISFRVNKVGR